MKVKDHFRISKFLNFHKILTPNQINYLSLKFDNFTSRFVEKHEEFKPSVKSIDFLEKTNLKRIELENITGFNSKSTEIIDLENSFGNYYKDSDGNMILDCHMSNGHNALGYNHRNLLRETRLEHYMPYSISSGNSGYSEVPSTEYAEKVLKDLHDIAPINVEEVFLSKDSNSALEDAIRLACVSYIEKNENLTNKDFRILTFNGADYDFNNSSLKLNFPQIKYPYDENMEYNHKVEDEALVEFDGMVSELKNNNIIVPALVIEPAHYNDGFKYAGPNFYRRVMKIAQEAGIKVIINEVNTCGWMSGRPFTHFHWCTEISPDVVVFGGRMQLCGFFYNRNMINSTSFEEFSFNISSKPDMLSYKKLMLLKKMVYNVDWLDLQNTNFYSSMRTEFNEIRKKSRFDIKNIRGIGKVFVFDVEHKILRDELVHLAKLKGIKLNSLGDVTVALTPSLMFTEIHFDYVKRFLIECNPSTKYISRI